MIMCEVAYIDPAVPIMTGVKPADCFTAESQIAHDFFDFDKVMSSSVGATNTIDENEIAFKMRLDERVLPVGPLTDNSHITVTVESEVYYIGNQHPTRRLLTAGTTAAPYQKQQHVKSMMHAIYYKPANVNMCKLDEALTTTDMTLTFDYKNMAAPATAVDANNYALTMKMQMETHLNTMNAITVSRVEKCDSSGCTLFVDVAKPSNRRLSTTPFDEKLVVTLSVSSTQYASAGKIANNIQSEIMLSNFKTVDAFVHAEVSAMDIADCQTIAHNSKLASSASAFSTLVAFALALWNLL